MATSRDLPADRLAIGQLLVRLPRVFRVELASGRHEYTDIRETHFQIFGNIRMGGIRLTELAARAQLSLAATSELVNDLETLGYLARRPDPADGRAKLIDLTSQGQKVLQEAGIRVAEIEARWRAAVGRGEFESMCATMQRLLDQLDPDDARA